MLRKPEGAAAAGVTFYSSASQPVAPLSAKPGWTAGELVANVYGGVADFPKLVEAAHAGGSDVFVELGADQLRAAAARDVLGSRGAAHVSVAIDRKGAEPWRQMLKLCATLISHGETGCQVGPLYHPKLLRAFDARVNGPPVSAAKKKAVKQITINGRFNGLSVGDAPPPAPSEVGDSRLLTTLKRIPTSTLDLVELAGSQNSSRVGSGTSLSSRQASLTNLGEAN